MEKGRLLDFAVIPVTPLMQNCSLLWCRGTMRGVVVDPGGDVERILQKVEEEGIELERVLLTHAHIDHVGGAGELADRCRIPIEGPHAEDRFLLEGLEQQSAMFGVPLARVFTPDRWLQQGDKVALGNLELEVRHCPGHSPGHVVFVQAAAGLAAVGDVLFRGSIGRTDLFGGDHQGLLDSIRQKLWPLGDEIAFIPGHGPMSTFGEERRSNPFVADGL